MLFLVMLSARGYRGEAVAQTISRNVRAGSAVHHWPERFLEWLEATCPPSHLRSRPRSADSFVTHGRL